MEQYLFKKADKDSSRIFRVKTSRPQLEVLTINKQSGEVAEQLFTRREINSIEDLEDPQEENHARYGRIFTIRHARTWSTLDISRELFQRLLDIHHVLPELWKVLYAFGLKSCENEYGFPTPQGKESSLEGSEIQESAYVFRRVERNEKASLDYPWSIRQTGIYQRLMQPDDMSQGATFVLFLIAPSASVDGSVFRRLTSEGPTSEDSIQTALMVLRILVAESLVGWSDYMCWLEEQLRIRSVRVCANPMLGTGREMETSINEEDGRRLKHLEDNVADLLLILHTMMLNVRRIQRNCQRLCAMRCAKKSACSCRQAIHWFEDHAMEAQSYHERAALLQGQVQSVQSLLSELLMRELTIRSARDAIAVKLMAMIGLIFLPITVVANVFSTQFVSIDDGSLRVSSHFWLIFTLALPATCILFVIWLAWTRYECGQLQTRPSKKLGSEVTPEKTEENYRMHERMTWFGGLSKLPRRLGGVRWRGTARASLPTHSGIAST